MDGPNQKRVSINQDIIDSQHWFKISADRSKASKMNSIDKLEIQEIQYMKSSWNHFNGPLDNIEVQEWIPYYGDKKGLETVWWLS